MRLFSTVSACILESARTSIKLRPGLSGDPALPFLYQYISYSSAMNKTGCLLHVK